MARRSKNEINKQFVEAMRDWYYNPGFDAGGCESVSLESIDAQLHEIAERVPDVSQLRSYRRFRDDGILALELLVQRYHLELGVHIVPALWATYALRSASSAALRVSPLLWKPAQFQEGDRHVSDSAHEWIRAEASVGVALLVICSGSSKTDALRRVARALLDSGYAPAGGGKEASADAIERWVSGVLKPGSPQAETARDAFTNFRLLQGDAGQEFVYFIDNESLGDKMLSLLATTVEAVTLRNIETR